MVVICEPTLLKKSDEETEIDQIMNIDVAHKLIDQDHIKSHEAKS